MKDQIASGKNSGKRANKKGQGRKITYPLEQEDKLLSWILEKREVHFVHSFEGIVFNQIRISKHLMAGSASLWREIGLF